MLVVGILHIVTVLIISMNMDMTLVSRTLLKITLMLLLKTMWRALMMIHDVSKQEKLGKASNKIDYRLRQKCILSFDFKVKRPGLVAGNVIY